MTSKRRESGTKLPYPAGDYASPPDTFSPNNSPPSSISSAMQPLSTTILGLPLYTSAGLGTLVGASYSTTSLSSLSSSLGGGRPLSLPTQPKFVSASSTPLNRMASPTPATKGQGLPPLKSGNTDKRQTSVSLTPTAGARKRYTVTLGGPITAPPDEDEFSLNAASSFYATANTNVNVNTSVDPHATVPLKNVGTPRLFSCVIGGSFSSSPVGVDNDNEGKHKGGEGDGEGEETIGKSSGIKLRNANGSGTSSRISNSTSNGISPGGPGGGDYKSTATMSPCPPCTRRIRVQSTYGYASLLPPQAPQTLSMGTTVPLKPKLRSRSTECLSSGTDRGGTGDGMISSGGGGTKFVDPLLLRRQQQSQEGLQVKMPMPKLVGKVPIGQLVVFFDREKGGRTQQKGFFFLLCGWMD